MNQRTVSIYLILDDAESPRYVGRSFDPARRPQDHLRKHPEWAKSYRLLESVSVGTRWQDRERYWIAYYRRFASLENIARGGGSAGPKSPDAIRRQREKVLGRKQSPETIAKIREALRRRTPEQWAAIGAKVSQSKKGKVPNWTPEGKQRTIEALKRRGSPMQGKRHSAETIAILRIKNRRPPNSGRFQPGKPNPKSEAWRRAVSVALTGRRLSEETKQKIREKRALQDMSSRRKRPAITESQLCLEI